MTNYQLLEARVARLAARRNRLRTWSILGAIWLCAAASAGVMMAMEHRLVAKLSFTAPIILVSACLAVLLVLLFLHRRRPDLRAEAQEIERHYPELDGRLLTALRLPPQGDNTSGYLRERVHREALAHATQNTWTKALPRSRILCAATAHWLALLLLLLTLTALNPPLKLLSHFVEPAVTVSPGDILLERGSTLVVFARFAGALPPRVELVFGAKPDITQHLPLAKSLADPLFGGTIPEVSSNFQYHVEYGGQRSRDFTVSVFEYPRLERADVDVTYPDYTGLTAQRIENTRRVSAVEGSSLSLQLQLNKPVRSARLLAKNNQAIALSVDPKRPVAALPSFPLVATAAYDLQLVDESGRTNKVPAQFVFAALTNRTPEFRLASPRGDTRPSPLEEINFDGTVWDDFGLKTYGIGYTIPGRDTKFVELGRDSAGQQKRQVKYTLPLEELGLEPDQLIGWFLWAEDIGPDGEVRRSSSDLFFGEVRPFEEVFREGQGMDGQQQQQQGQSQQQERMAKLTELQKQIITATWNVQRAGAKAKSLLPRQPSPTPQRSSAIVPQKKLAAVPNLLHAAAFLAAIGTSDLFARAADPSESAAAPDEPAPEKQKRAQPGGSGTNDLDVLRDSQTQALEQARAASRQQQDARTTALWAQAQKEMQTALERLERATNASVSLEEALAAEQAAYQALLKLQQHEYQVSRSRRQNSSGSARQQQMQRQLEQLDLTQSEDRYETQRQAQKPQPTEKREQLQAENRLQELARRQQDLNERLSELQTELQQARTEQEREDIRRRLKRLQEEEEQMLADVDELQQRMNKPENQPRMAEERKKLEQTREDVRKAADAAAQGSAGQALASGTRAQRQFQDLRDQLRKENAGQFSDELRQMRNQAREIAREQEELTRNLQQEDKQSHRSLSENSDHAQAVQTLAKEKEAITNLVDRASQISQQAEAGEPLLSKNLYETVRKFAQDSNKTLQDTRDDLVGRGLMSRSTFEWLKNDPAPDAAKLTELASELLRQGFEPSAADALQHFSPAVNDLKTGVERAAGNVLGDDTEALRLAQQEVNQLADQLQREMDKAQNEGAASAGSTNRSAQSGAKNSQKPGSGQPQEQAQEAQANQGQPNSQNAKAQEANGRQGEKGQASSQDSKAQAANERQGEKGQPSQQQSAGENASDTPQGGGERRAGANSSRTASANAGGGEGGDISGSLNRNIDRLARDDTDLTAGPIAGEGFIPWSDRLRDVEEMLEMPDLRAEVSRIRDRARTIRQAAKRERKKPDWAVVRLEVMKPLSELQQQIADELGRRQSTDSLAPIDRDPVPNRYSELVRRYYEDLGKR